MKLGCDRNRSCFDLLLGDVWGFEGEDRGDVKGGVASSEEFGFDDLDVCEIWGETETEVSRKRSVFSMDSFGGVGGRT